MSEEPVYPWHATYKKLCDLMNEQKGYCDLIGDIHGHATELEQLLTKMGYQKNKEKGHYEYPDGSRIVIFVGDLVDRGKEIRETLQIVKAMVDEGTALCIMGNHEYNAIAFWHQPCVRPHSLKNIDQHAATIHQFKNYENEWEMYLKWFRTLPLYLDLPHLRVVHALWDQNVFNLQHDQPKEPGKTAKVQIITKMGSIKTNYWFCYPSHGTHLIEKMLKGEDIKLPPNFKLVDKDGNVRDRSRIKWWLNPVNLTYAEYVEDIEHMEIPGFEKIMLPDEMIAIKYGSGYSKDEKPVFFGHYWLRFGENEKPRLQKPNVCCLDYSVAKGGHLVAYRWNDEKTNQLNVDNFVYV